MIVAKKEKDVKSSKSIMAAEQVAALFSLLQLPIASILVQS